MTSAVACGRITARIADGIAAVEIDDPARRNAMTRAMCIELQELMPSLDADPEVTVITLRGAGTTFSAGAAIDELSSVLMDTRDGGTPVDHLSRADLAIASTAKPTIAMVDGACIGGGWQIASACDFIVTSERSIFAITPAKIGVIYPRAGIERLIRQVGPATAKLLLLTGKTLSAAEAHDLGLVAEVVAVDEFASHCSAMARTLLGNSRFSMHRLKSLVDLTVSADPELGAKWGEAWDAMAAGPDMATGIDAFLHRERPRFTWTPEP
ncbi:enoyl-CoA hydratase/isomerase family protein [uncultured Amnibacterium sp.]|uniref:enoyl-CoA hydratase/isomerase family protein n=1 Tax=uncultured Amnibacterium sp. TaxID=1631851 RepID=UPI0035CC9881